MIVVASLFAIGVSRKTIRRRQRHLNLLLRKHRLAHRFKRRLSSPKGRCQLKRGPDLQTDLDANVATHIHAGRKKGSIAGTIKLAPGLEKNVKAGQALFILRRDAGEGKKGMILAAKKINVTGAQMFRLSMYSREMS